ncbi:MAG: hypothetical protein JW873_03785 [Candidatus Saganbacteria bacterium]|nr:hypothetical protein [Candidatus Saganbacteria bacterium]
MQRNFGHILVRSAIFLLLLASWPAGAAKNSPLTLKLLTDKSVYRAGEPVKMTLSVKNRSGRPVAGRLSSAQKYDFIITDKAGKVVWRWSAGKVFALMITPFKLGPGGTASYEAGWAGTARVKPGKYSVKGALRLDPKRYYAVRKIEIAE